VLEVADDGTGFDTSDTEPQGGLGLASMRDRAYSIGGELTIDAAPGRGTTVRLEVPL
jgi:signal transduction histidine kinase